MSSTRVSLLMSTPELDSDATFTECDFSPDIELLGLQCEQFPAQAAAGLIPQVSSVASMES